MSEQVVSLEAQFRAEGGDCTVLFKVGDGCHIWADGEPVGYIGEDKVASMLRSGPGAEADVVLAIEKRTGCLEAADENVLLNTIMRWQRNYR